VIARCVNIKRKIVFQDEFDRGTRQLLNFGHTFGHAIEKCSGYEIPHGHAVATGMVMMSRAAESLGLVREKCSDRLAAILEKYGLPVSCPFDADELASAVLGDKKRMGDIITVVIPLRPGKCRLHPVQASEVKQLVLAGLGREGE
jgi:3-dehydroquinate synthase